MREALSWTNVIVLSLLILGSGGIFLASAADGPKCLPTAVPVVTGAEEVNAPVVPPPYVWPQPEGTDQILGDTVTIGTTWYEAQHNGTVGRMIEKDSNGFVHLVWMNGTDVQATDRHVYYNKIDESGTQGWPGTGYPVESSPRAGYTTLDVDHDNRAFPAFHQEPSSGVSLNMHTAVAMDFFPYAGAFLVFEPEWVYYTSGGDMELIWPRIMFDQRGVAHIVSTENPPYLDPAHPQRQYYTKGEVDLGTFSISYSSWDPDSTWQQMPWTMTIAADVATSDVSDRVAFAWTTCRDEGFPQPELTFSQWNNDIWMLIDDDGEDFHFQDAFNLTQFIPPDPFWYPETLLVCMDTLRAFTDLNVFIDQDDWVHVVFSTRAWFEAFDPQYSYWNASIIWHWSEQFPGEFQVVADEFDMYDIVDPGAWNVKAQRPQLGQDPTTGILYCMYQLYDTDSTALSAGGWPSGEICITYSENGGFDWHVGTNITHTITPSGAAAGMCLSELTPSMAKLVDDTCHIIYVLDLDAGFVMQDEGSWTLNPVKYHKLPVDLIPATPLIPQFPYDPDGIRFHVGHGDWPGIPGAGRYEQPKIFGLEQNYPNPFNPATSIRFWLDEVSDVTLQVFNLKGEVVAALASGTYGTGQHTVAFDGSGLASGVYLCKLKAGPRTLVRKMLLMK